MHRCILLPETFPNFSFITWRNMVPGTFHFHFNSTISKEKH